MAQLVKNLSATWERRPGFDSWVGKIPWERKRLPTPVFWPGEFHGLYSPWGRKESHITEWLSLHTILNYCLIEQIEATYICSFKVNKCMNKIFLLILIIFVTWTTDNIQEKGLGIKHYSKWSFSLVWQVVMHILFEWDFENKSVLFAFSMKKKLKFWTISMQTLFRKEAAWQYLSMEGGCLGQKNILLWGP